MSIGQQIYCKKHRQRDLDSCSVCDQERRDEENARRWSRAFSVVVTVRDGWLTNEGEDDDREEGWKVVRDDLEAMLRLESNPAIGYKVEWIEWTEEPQAEGTDGY